jgi:hypothetical protein
MKMAAREANVAKPEFEFTGFFRVTFKRTVLVQSSGTNEKQANNE